MSLNFLKILRPSDLKSEYLYFIVDRDNIKKNDKRSNTMSEDKYNKMLESLNSDPDAIYVSLVEARERKRKIKQILPSILLSI